MKLVEWVKLYEYTFKGDGNIDVKGIKDLEYLPNLTGLEDGYIYYSQNHLDFSPFHKQNSQAIIICPFESNADFDNIIFSSTNETCFVYLNALRYFDPYKNITLNTSGNIHPSAMVASTAKIDFSVQIMNRVQVGENTIIHPGVVLEPHSKIGANTVIFPNVVVGAGCIIGNDCIIHSGTVIGSDGFGFLNIRNERYKIPHIGKVIIKDKVEMGSNCTIDRGTIEDTVIGENTKFDNQIHIAHNCFLGKNIYMAACSMLAGSVTVEDDCWFSFHVGATDHITIKKGTQVMAMSLITKDTIPNTTYSGNPARPVKENNKKQAYISKIPKILDKIVEIENKLKS